MWIWNTRCNKYKLFYVRGKLLTAMDVCGTPAKPGRQVQPTEDQQNHAQAKGRETADANLLHLVKGCLLALAWYV